MNSSPQPKKNNLMKNDKNKPLVGQIASKVTQLLPNKITQWLNTAINGSPQIAESTDSSTEDESTDGPLQQPAKRMRYSVGLPLIPETRSISTNTEPSELSDHVKINSKFSLDSNSTHLSKPCEEPLVIQSPIEKRTYNLQESSASSHQSLSRKRKSFDISSNLNQLDESHGEYKPFFRIGLAASSPFYRANNRYAGSDNVYVNQPNVKSKKTTHINNSLNDSDAAMSNSTKRIMDLLINFSSPTIDARRIPQITNTSMNNTNKSMNNSPTSKKITASRNTELYVPSIASVLKLKERSKLMKTTSVARRIIASQSSSSGINPVGSLKSHNTYPSDSIFTSKIRTRVTKKNQKDLELEQIVAKSLPTATLQIDKDNLPKFSFDISLPESAFHSNHEKDVVASTTSEPKRHIVSSAEPNDISTEKDICKTTSDTKDSIESNNFKFSSPDIICVDAIEDLGIPQKFALYSPERNVEVKKQNKESVLGKDNPSTKLVNIRLEKEQEKEVIKKCTDCKVELKQDQKEPEKCADCKTTKQPEPLLTVTSTKWRCGDCWVDNDEEKDKCVCCGGKKPSKTKSADVSHNDKEKDDLSNKTTVVSNTSDSNKPKNILPLSNVAPNSTLSHIVKQQSSKWECSNCMVRNDNNVSKCVCCETEKPGTSTPLKAKSFNFGVSPSTFKFGIDPKQNISSNENIKSIESMESHDKPPEKNNNVFFGNKIDSQTEKTTTETITKPTEPIKEISETPKVTFSFGINKDIPVNTFTPTSSPALFSFGLPKPTEKSNPVQDEKTNATPKIGIFGINTIKNDSSGANNMFTITQQTQSTVSKTESVTPQNTFSFSSSTFTPSIGLLNNQKTATSTETTTTLNNSIISTAQQSSPPSLPFFSKNSTTGGGKQPIFFKENESKTSAPLPLFPKSESTASLFQKPESTTTTTASICLFSKSKCITTAAATQPPVSNSPIFSFGNNAPQSSQQPAETPKFTFTFGANKSDSPTLFNAPRTFGSTVDKFNLSYPNTIGSALSGNNAISNNSMNTTLNNATLNANTLNNNVLGNNIISSNIMGSNTLVNNAMTSNPIEGNIMGNNAMGSNAMGSNAMSNNTIGNSAMGNNTISSNVLNNNVLGNNTMNNNELASSNGLTTSNPLAGLACGNGLSVGTGIGGDALPNTLNPVNPLMAGTSATSPVGGNIFNRVQNKDMWPGSNNTGSNIFATNTVTNTVQQPAAFAFYNPTSFNANNTTSTTTFGNPAPPQAQPSQQAQAPQSSQIPQGVPPTSNIFGNTSNNQPPLFPNAVPNQPTQPNVFGATPSSVPPMGLFGSSGFGAPNRPFENSTMNSTQTFNFGDTNNQPNMFGFTQRLQTPGVYNFGSPAGSSSTPQVQFNMGSAPVAGRRVRKVIRRTTAR